MADLTRMKGLAEVAAASADPVVRGIGQKYLTLLEDLTKIEAFFDIYTVAKEAAPAALPPAVKAKPKVARAANGSGGGGNRIELFKTILQDGPLSLDDLRTAFCNRHPEVWPPPSRESIRVTLSKHQAVFGRVSETDSRYVVRDQPADVA